LADGGFGDFTVVGGSVMKLVMKIYCTKPDKCDRRVNSCIWGAFACEYARFEEADSDARF